MMSLMLNGALSNLITAAAGITWGRTSLTGKDDAGDAEDRVSGIMLVQMMPMVCAATSPPRLMAPCGGVLWPAMVMVMMLMVLRTEWL